MNKSGKALSICVIFVIVLGLLGCEILPHALKDLLVTATLTATSAPTAADTATPNPTATVTAAVMKSPLIFATCLDKEDCPDAVVPAAFLTDGLQRNKVNEITIPFDQTIKLDVGWLAKDQIHLDEDLQHIIWVFTIDDQNYFTKDMLVNSEVPDRDNPGETNPGTWLAVTISGWEIGEPHYIRFGYYLDAAIDDGWSVTAADYSEITTLYVVPENIPTITAGPTITNTPLPKPAVTQAAVQPTATTGAPLVLNITLKVENKCPESHVVIFNGPLRLKYSVGPGETVEYQAAAGTYTWKIDNTYTGGPQILDASMGWWTYTLCQ